MKHSYLTFLVIIFTIAFGIEADAQSFVWTSISEGTNQVGSVAAGRGVGTDAQGNRYVAGEFSRAMVFDDDTLFSAGNSMDMFVAKFDSAGNYLWARRAGGFLNDWGLDIAVDEQGNSFVVGRFSGIADFGGETIESFVNLDDAFLASWDTDGNFRWVTKVGGQVVDIGRCVAVNQFGEVFLAGTFRITAFLYSATSPVPDDTLYSFSALVSDAFIAAYGSGGGLLWARSGGGANGAMARAINFDSAGDCLVTGLFGGTAFFEGQSLVSSDLQDIFIAKYRRQMGTLLWARRIGDSGGDDAYGISLDAADNIYLAGYEFGTLVLGQDTVDGAISGGAFLAKLDPEAVPIWGRAPVSTGGTEYKGLDVNSAGECVVTGNFNASQTIFGEDTLRSATGFLEMMTVHYSADGDYRWSQQAGNTLASEEGYDVWVDDSSNCAYVAGGYTGWAIFGADTLERGPGMYLTKFRLDDSIVGIGGSATRPSTFVLQQNYPNPFNPETTIRYQLTTAADVELSVFNLLGQRIITLANGRRQAGEHAVSWDGRNRAGMTAASGVYLYRLKADGVAETRKMLLVR